MGEVIQVDFTPQIHINFTPEPEFDEGLMEMFSVETRVVPCLFGWEVWVKKAWAHEEYMLPDFYLSESAALCEAETEKIKIWTQVDEDIGDIIDIIGDDYDI
jgi:hypothetical protein